MSQSAAPVPSELLGNGTPAEALRSFQRFWEVLGGLLAEWPEIFAQARWLRERGIRVAQPLDGAAA